VQHQVGVRTHVLNEPEPASVALEPPGESRAHDSGGGHKIVYWHRELPPLDAEPLGEHVVEANSMRVTGSLERRGDLWDRCYQDLMARAEHRLRQEVSRLGGHYAHVLGEATDSRHDDRSGEAWLQGRLTYVLLRRGS
jgi:hypothetical protein